MSLTCLSRSTVYITTCRGNRFHSVNASPIPSCRTIPPESPTSTRPCPKLVLSDGSWATSQHDIAVEWVSLVEKRHAGSTSTPHRIISDADRSAGHFARVSLVPSLVPSPTQLRQTFAKLQPRTSKKIFFRPNSSSSFLCLCKGPRHVLPTPGLEGLCHVPETKGVTTTVRFTTKYLSVYDVTRFARLRYLHRLLRHAPNAFLALLPPGGVLDHDRARRLLAVGHRPPVASRCSTLPSSPASSYRGRPSSCLPPGSLQQAKQRVLRWPQLSTHARPSRHDSLELPCYERGHTPTRDPLSMRPSTRTPLRALHGTCCSNRLTQHWTRSRMLKHPRYSQRCDHSIIDFVTAPAGDKSSKTGQPASLPAPHLPAMRVHGPVPLWAN